MNFLAFRRACIDVAPVTMYVPKEGKWLKSEFDDQGKLHLVKRACYMLIAANASTLSLQVAFVYHISIIFG